METQELFVLPSVSIHALQDMCQTYHGIWRQTKLTADLLEEAIARALEYHEPYRGHVTWQARSHNTKADILLLAPVPLELSVKSGTPLKGKNREMLEISGHRLTRAGGNMHIINQLLRALISDVVLCFVHHASRRQYECLYIDAAVFVYPLDAGGWEPKMGEKRGRISQYVFRSPGGLVSTIKPPMSWQIWWNIPRSLCRQGPFITY
jgi:hypothetical protein